jgi:O-antigen ligase
MWLATLDGIAASPWIGHGEDQFVSERGAWFYNHPHNSVLQFLYQWGIIGTAFALTIVGPIIANYRKAARTFPEAALPAIGALTGLLLMSLLEGSLYHVFPLMVVIICLAVLASVQQDGAGGSPARAAES